MWYKVQGWNILASSDVLPDPLQGESVARIQREGWRLGIETAKPVVNDQQDVKLIPSYDPKTDTVTEIWQVIDKDFYVVSAIARRRRLLKKLAKTDPVAALIQQGGLNG